VLRDVAWGKVSRAGATADYGVVITGPDDAPAADIAESARLRTKMRAERPDQEPFFNRGPGYAKLAGAAFAEVDRL
jgi:N-methylhydantoinase B